MYLSTVANLKRVRVVWSGSGVVGPGVSTFYFVSAATGFPTDLQTFFQAIKAALPSSVTVSVPNTGDTIDETTGALVGVWTDSGGSSTVGTSSTLFAGGVGMRCRWITAGIHRGRRVIGSTFIAPMQSASFSTDGTPDAGSVTLLQTAASALVSSSAGDMVIWSKPQPPAGSDGESNVVLSALVPDKTSWLRSRRV